MELVDEENKTTRFERDNDSEVPDNFPFEEIADLQPAVVGELQSLDNNEYSVHILKDQTLESRRY